MNELWEDYFNFLIWRGRLEKMTKYHNLFESLHNIKFIYIIDRDDNRKEDGKNLRNYYKIPNRFYRNEDLINDFYDREASVFEVLLALSIRVDNEIIGDPSEEHPESCFLVIF